MKQLLLTTLLLLVLAGCATVKEMPTGSDHKVPSQKLSTALHELEKDRRVADIPILEDLVAEPGIKGVTDEALFRLSVLNLFQEEKDGLVTSIGYLERLRHEYADSSWTQQSKPLLDLLNSVAALKKQNRNLRNVNNSLSKENKELHQSIKRLKNLDLQMERKSR